MPPPRAEAGGGQGADDGGGCTGSGDFLGGRRWRCGRIGRSAGQAAARAVRPRPGGFQGV